MLRYPSAPWSPSPNFDSRKGEAVDRIVIHHTDGQPRLDRAVEHLCNPVPSSGKRVSAHFVVAQDGAVAQLVELDHSAWHCSDWNRQSIGVEHIARSPHELSMTDTGFPLTEAQLQASAALVAWIQAQISQPLAIVPHCANPATHHRDCGRADVDGGIWPWQRYLAMVSAALPVL